MHTFRPALIAAVNSILIALTFLVSTSCSQLGSADQFDPLDYVPTDATNVRIIRPDKVFADNFPVERRDRIESSLHQMVNGSLMMGDKVVVGHDEGMESYGVYLDKLTWVIAAEHSLSLTGMRGIDPGSIPDTYHIKGPLNLFRGEIDFKIMRDKLHSLNYNLDYYRGQEIWGPAREEGRIRYYTYFALYEEEGYFVVGFPEPVLDSIIALERGYPMLSDKPSNSLTQLIERLGYEEVDVQASDECYFYLDYQGCLSSGSAGTIALLDRTYISLFSNEKHAEAAAQELHDGYIEVTVEGEFVITKFSTPE